MVDITGGERGGRLGLPSFRDAVRVPFWEFRSSFLHWFVKKI